MIVCNEDKRRRCSNIMNRAYGTATHAVNKRGVVDMIVCKSSACSDLSVLMSEFVTFPKAVVWCAVSAQ